MDKKIQDIIDLLTLQEKSVDFMHGYLLATMDEMLDALQFEDNGPTSEEYAACSLAVNKWMDSKGLA